MSVASLAARFRRLGANGDRLAAEGAAADLRGRLEGVLGGHVRTGTTIGETTITATDGAVTVSGPRGLRYSPGAEAEIHRPVGPAALRAAMGAFR
jgi:hypothetical protein